jgi:hypothetical protein
MIEIIVTITPLLKIIGRSMVFSVAEQPPAYWSCQKREVLDVIKEKKDLSPQGNLRTSRR